MSIPRMLLTVIVPVVIGGIAGVGLAWLLVTLHAVSPDNIPAGIGIGFGGDLAGLAAGLLLLGLKTATPEQP